MGGKHIQPRRESIGAFQVDKTRRIVQVATAVFYCLLAAGIVFGYAAIKPVLIKEGVYRDECTKKELEDNVRVCFKQEIHLNFMFTIAAVSTNVVSLAVGACLDRYGPRVCALLGSLFMTIGCILFAFAWDIKKYGVDAYIPAYFFLAIAGPFVFISSFQLSNTFPTSSGMILAMLTGAFDSSSAVFLVYRLIYSATNGRFFPRKFFLMYLIVPAFILIAQVFWMPSISYKSVNELVVQIEEEDETDSSEEELDPEERAELRRVRRESVASEIDELLGPKGGERHKIREEKKAEISGVAGAMHGKSAAQQIKSWWFILITLFTVVQMTRINFFVATIRPQYEYLFKSHEKAVAVNDYFDFALPLGGLIAVPFIGVLLDNFSTVIVLSVLVGTATVIGILGCLPYVWAAYIQITLFVVYRPMYYSTVSDYTAKVMGFAHFGKVYGLLIALAGIFNFSQSFFDYAQHRWFNSDPRPINILLLLVAAAVGTCLIMYVFQKSKSMKRTQLEEEAEEAEHRNGSSTIYGAA